MKIDYFQVGAHEGNTKNDHIFKEIQKQEELNCIFIEPVPYLFERLKHNYNNESINNNYIFLNIAISNLDGEITLYVPSEKNDLSKYPYWVTQLASSNREHINNHMDGINLPHLIIDELKVSCYKLNTIIREHNINEINYLVVDTEGHDFDILMDLDLNILKPNKIIFENKHMDGICKKSEKYNKLLNKFYENGYILVYEEDEDTCIELFRK
jgi:FkbM family methyltransferase